MKRFLIIALLLSASVVASAQIFALKTDLVKWGTASINLEPEVRVGKKSTLSLGLSYNPWTYKSNKKWKHILVQPEYRYWTCHPFGGHFLAVHPTYAHFNAGNVKSGFGLWKGLKDYRYQGNLYGAGVGYGYHWVLSPRWSIEVQVGVGVAYMKYNKYVCQTCGDRIGSDSKLRFMPSKVAFQLVYMLK